jgi:hypothetical protein
LYFSAKPVYLNCTNFKKLGGYDCFTNDEIAIKTFIYLLVEQHCNAGITFINFFHQYYLEDLV